MFPTASWWAHALLVLGFLNYLPYSKHLHVIVSLPNTFVSNTSGRWPRVMRPMDLEDESAEQFGALLKPVSDTTQGFARGAMPAPRSAA